MTNQTKPAARHVVISVPLDEDCGSSDPVLYPIDTDEEIAVARAAMRAAGPAEHQVEHLRYDDYNLEKAFKAKR